MASKKKVVIIGALGNDFHVFNTVFRENSEYKVVAFTIAGEQNVGTTGDTDRCYPPELAGDLYPKGVPMFPEHLLETIIADYGVDEAVFAYSDVRHERVMHCASKVLAAGANFRLISPKMTQIKSSKPVIAVCAVRTGCGKSQVSRVCCKYFKKKGYKVVAIREPMPYGDLTKQAVMRFADASDFDKYFVTVEEREEYEAYVNEGLVIYTGVDYARILREAEKEADVIIWDGGNNEVSFYVPDLLFVLADPLRPGDETSYHPGELNACSADVFIINKVNSVKDPQTLVELENNLGKINPTAHIVKTNSEVSISDEDAVLVKNQLVLVVEDGPTVTHGEMSYGAGFVAAQKYGAVVCDPKESAKGCIKTIFGKFPHLQQVLPAMGYNEEQLADLTASINASKATYVLNGSPMDLAKLLQKTCKKKIIQVSYNITKHSDPTVESQLERFESFIALPPAQPVVSSSG